MRMVERPKWLKIVGGKDHKPEWGNSTPEIKAEMMDSELVRLYKERKDNRPADLEERANKRMVEALSPSIRRWTKAQLHQYLSHDAIWTKPSQTLVVFEEIRERLLAGSLDPRD